MNTRPILDESSGPLALSASFNDDNSYFSVALETGFHIFIAKTGASKQVRDIDFGSGIGYVEMVGTTAYMALVGGGKQPKFPQNKVLLWNDSKQKVSTSVELKTPIQRVRLSKYHLVVVQLNCVSIYKMGMPPTKIAEFETANNPYGLCCLNSKLVAFPGRTHGKVQLVDLATRNVSIALGHTSPLRALGLSRDGDMIATASEQGTLIRIWSTENATKLGELRRGVDHAAIFSVAFSPDGSLLAVTSDKSTLHIFDLSNMKTASRLESDPNTHKWGVLSKVPFLPRPFSDTYSSATAHFELGDEPVGWSAASKSATFGAEIPGVPGGKPTKGLIGWLDDQSLVVVSAGCDARWEKFVVGPSQDGKRVCIKEGWKKYLQ
ncbi:WD repeat domain phosphoinositide-interacting protein 4 [Zopfia rhizophila CBS 207.26]|uniref:WD repeat domain phosphoinositide-interacting protein 4 n=1 Tax=Zopfia rhizophila CBS 207.26 TaxID=1314779 RepID=A0A6A6D9I9_9PEZI|nr:WD repeat domain phosphoinositide-interacting protein 4 [Zopfia rhizophila CBS 207.26]